MEQIKIEDQILNDFSENVMTNFIKEETCTFDEIEIKGEIFENDDFVQKPNILVSNDLESLIKEENFNLDQENLGNEQFVMENILYIKEEMNDQNTLEQEESRNEYTFFFKEEDCSLSQNNDFNISMKEILDIKEEQKIKEENYGFSRNETDLLIKVKEEIEQTEEQKGTTLTVNGQKLDNCAFCRDGHTFASVHLPTEHTSDGEQPAISRQCNFCEKSFPNISQLKAHMLLHKPKSNVCVFCKKCFVKSGELEKHYLTHRGDKRYTRMKPKSILQESYLQEHISTHNGSFMCKICKLKFLEASEMNKHIHTHFRERPHVCKVCKDRFSSRKYLSAHMAKHIFEKNYICKYCEKSFAVAGQLIRHVQASHNGEENSVLPPKEQEKEYFQCTDCKLIFEEKYELDDHTSTHLKEMRYICKYCDMTFKKPIELIKHARIH